MSRPQVDPAATYDEISAARTPREIGRRLADARGVVLAAYDVYAGASDNVAAVTAVDASPATAEDLQGNYTYLQRSADEIRGKIFAVAHHNRCAMCGQASATTLEHFLPKSAFPEFSVLPVNLIPACSRCNTRKGTRYAENGEPLYLHAYFDDLSRLDRFLFAEVSVAGTAFEVSFSVEPPDTVAATIARRIRSHFDRLGLADYYRAEGVNEISERRATLAEQIAGDAAPEEVRAYLEAEARGVAADKGWNHWRYALLTAMAANADVCAGAFV